MSSPHTHFWGMAPHTHFWGLAAGPHGLFSLVMLVVLVLSAVLALAAWRMRVHRARG